MCAVAYLDGGFLAAYRYVIFPARGPVISRPLRPSALKTPTPDGKLVPNHRNGTRYISPRVLYHWTIIFIRGAKILRRQGPGFPASRDVRLVSSLILDIELSMSMAHPCTVVSSHFGKDTPSPVSECGVEMREVVPQMGFISLYNLGMQVVEAQLFFACQASN